MFNTESQSIDIAKTADRVARELGDHELYMPFRYKDERIEITTGFGFLKVTAPDNTTPFDALWHGDNRWTVRRFEPGEWLAALGAAAQRLGPNKEA